jgi:hypothetical protein
MEMISEFDIFNICRTNENILSKTGQCINYFLTSLKPMIQLEEKIYNIIFELGITMELVRIIEGCLTEISYINLIDKHVSDKFLIQNGLK